MGVSRVIFDACGHVVSGFYCVWAGTHTCTHNLGFPDGFDDEEEEEEEEGKVNLKARHLACWQGRQHFPI